METFKMHEKKDMGYYINLAFFVWSCVYLSMFAIIFFRISILNYFAVKLITYILGLMALIYNLFYKHVYKNIRFYPYILAFLASYLITNILTREYCLIPGIQDLFLTSLLYLCVLYSGNYGTGSSIKSTFDITNFIFNSIITIGTIVSIVMYFVGYSDVFRFNGFLMFQGFIESRLFGVFHDPNFASLWAITVIIISFYYKSFINGNKFKGKHIYYNVLIFINYIYFLLANSRTAKVIAYFLLFILTICYFKYFKSTKNVRDWKYITIRVLAVIMCFYAFSSISYRTLPILAEKIQSINSACDTTKQNVSNKKPLESSSLEREDIDGENVTNNRFTIWKSAIEISEEKPVFGMSYGKIFDIAKDIKPESYIAQTKYSLHNSYLEVFVASGIVGSIFWIFIVFNICRYILKKMISLTGKSRYRYCLFVAIISNYLIGGLMLSGMFFNYSLSGFVLFYYTGIALSDNDIRLFLEEKTIDG